MLLEFQLEKWHERGTKRYEVNLFSFSLNAYWLALYIWGYANHDNGLKKRDSLAWNIRAACFCQEKNKNGRADWYRIEQRQYEDLNSSRRFLLFQLAPPFGKLTERRGNNNSGLKLIIFIRNDSLDKWVCLFTHKINFFALRLFNLFIKQHLRPISVPVTLNANKWQNTIADFYIWSKQGNIVSKI